MDEKQSLVLEALCQFCSEPEVFKILDAEEILSSFSQAQKLSKEELLDTIKELKEAGLVNVKYLTQDEYCLSTSAIAKTKMERATDNPVERVLSSVVPYVSRNKKKVVLKLPGFWSAFIGAFLGGGLVMTIFVLIVKFALKS